MNIKDINPLTKKGKLKKLDQKKRELIQKIEGKVISNKLAKRKK